MNYSVNSRAIIFLPEIDAFNNFETIANDWQRDKIVKIKGVGYKILYFVYQKGKMSQEEILFEFQNENRQEIEKFLKTMLSRGILIEND